MLDHRKRIEEADVIVLIAPIWNFRMPAIMEGWIDKVLAPPWAFTFKRLVGNYGYPEGKLNSKKQKSLYLWCSKTSYYYFLFKFANTKVKKGCCICVVLEKLITDDILQFRL